MIEGEQRPLRAQRSLTAETAVVAVLSVIVTAAFIFTFNHNLGPTSGPASWAIVFLQAVALNAVFEIAGVNAWLSH